MPRLVVRDHSAHGDHDHGKGGRLHADGEAGDDVGGVTRLGLLRHPLDRREPGAGVVLGDPDHQRRDDEADQRAEVEIADRVAAEGDAVEDVVPVAPRSAVDHAVDDREVDDRRQHRRHQHAGVQRRHHAARSGQADEQRADDRGRDGQGAQQQRQHDRLVRAAQRTQEHGRHQRHGVGLEQVGRHAGVVADVVADVVGDHGRVTRVVLGDAGLDLAHQVGADVGRLGEDAAAQPGEHRDQRTAEGQADQGLGRLEVCSSIGFSTP